MVCARQARLLLQKQTAPLQKAIPLLRYVVTYSQKISIFTLRNHLQFACTLQAETRPCSDIELAEELHPVAPREDGRMSEVNQTHRSNANRNHALQFRAVTLGQTIHPGYPVDEMPLNGVDSPYKKVIYGYWERRSNAMAQVVALLVNLSHHGSE